MKSMREIVGSPEIPCDQTMIDWLVAQNALLDVSFRPQHKTRPVWEIMYIAADGKPYLSTATLLRTAICWAVRGVGGDT